VLNVFPSTAIGGDLGLLRLVGVGCTIFFVGDSDRNGLIRFGWTSTFFVGDSDRNGLIRFGWRSTFFAGDSDRNGLIRFGWRSTLS
jgi:hypothetical protein